MSTIFHPGSKLVYRDHPRFAEVKISVLVSSRDSDAMSVSMLTIAPGAGVPVHIHDLQADSIYVVAGSGEILINGEWRQVAGGDHIYVPREMEHGVRNTGPEPLQLLVHHSPPLL